jgi:hypothetical protein
MFGFGSIGLALSAVSTVSSLIEAAADGISQAAGKTQATTGQSFDSATTAASISSAAQTYGAPKEPGVVLPKFDERTQATLLAYQEMHRGA